LLWETSRVDATLMAIILVNLHGKRSQCLSNQMRQGKAMDPNYSVRWWKKRNMSPPEINPESFLRARVHWRYARGIPKLSYGHVERGDSTSVLNRLAASRRAAGLRPFDLLFTSPPYYGVTNYFYDQWLRLWMLGSPEIPTSSGEQWEGRFNSKVAYQQLLQRVFKEAAKCMNPHAVIYVRTDAREFTFKTTLEALKEAFPNKCLEMINRPFKRATQTALYGDKSKKPGEVDIILQ